MQGSAKLNTYCTAAIVVRATHDNKLLVEHCPTHYGHRTLLGHLRIPENDRLAIAGKRLQGIPFERILDDIRSSMDTSIQRIHLTTRKDIANIQQAYGIQEGQGGRQVQTARSKLHRRRWRYNFLQVQCRSWFDFCQEKITLNNWTFSHLFFFQLPLVCAFLNDSRVEHGMLRFLIANWFPF